MQIFLTTTPDKTVGTLGRVPILSLHKVENNSWKFSQTAFFNNTVWERGDCPVHAQKIELF